MVNEDRKYTIYIPGNMVDYYGQEFETDTEWTVTIKAVPFSCYVKPSSESFGNRKLHS